MSSIREKKQFGPVPRGILWNACAGSQDSRYLSAVRAAATDSIEMADGLIESLTRLRVMYEVAGDVKRRGANSATFRATEADEMLLLQITMLSASLNVLKTELNRRFES